MTVDREAYSTAPIFGPLVFSCWCSCGHPRISWELAACDVGSLCPACNMPRCLVATGADDHPRRRRGVRCAFCIARPFVVRALDYARRPLPSERDSKRPAPVGPAAAATDGATAERKDADAVATVAGEPAPRAAYASRRLWRRLAYRPTEFVDQVPATVGELLAGVGPDVRRIFLVGPMPGVGTPAGVRGWAHGELPPGWAHDARGHYLEGDSPVLAYTAPDGGRVEIHRAAAWFGEGRYSAAEAAAAWELVRGLIAEHFDGATILSTAAATGRELWQRTIARDVEYPVLDDEFQELIRATTGQGRITRDDELERRAQERPFLDGLHEFDGRLFYAALAWGLAIGTPVRDRGAEYLGQTRARYRVTFRVPRDWDERCECGAPGHAGIGLLGWRDRGGEWRWPSEPGATAETWCDGAELAVAAAHGWELKIRERLWWPAHAKPLDKWAAELVKMRERIPRTDAVVGELARNAVRALVLFPIGAFWGAHRRITRSVPIGTPVPEGAENIRAEGSHLLWTERVPNAMPALSHPEWSAAIWSRARARLLDAPTADKSVRAGALNVPARDVIAFRTDALYLASRPRWPDDGRAGRFRCVRSIAGPLAAPRSTAELLRTTREGH